MPWDGRSFGRHNHSLSPTQAAHAAHIANAVLRRSGNEGVAIATANKLARHAAGGMVDPSIALPGMAGGGEMSLSQGNPWWARQEAYAAARPTTGYLAGETPGRADSVRTTTPSRAYVWPADVVSGVGQGNPLAGVKILQSLLANGPYGLPLPKGGGGRGSPRPPSPYQERAKGGHASGAAKEAVPVALSHGEFVSTPEEMEAFGGGDIERAYRIADELVLEFRRRNIEALKKLKPPVGSKTK